MTFGQILLSIGIAIIGTAGATFGFIQFLIKRKDDKEEKNVQSLIDASIKKERTSISQEIKDAVQQGVVDCGVIGDKAIRQSEEMFEQKLEEGLKARGEEGKERYNAHAAAIKEINAQIKQNNEQISELAELSKSQLVTMSGFAESLTALNKMVKLSAESQRNSNYDRILVVANKILRDGKITISEKTNLKQLYSSWQELHGIGEKLDPKIVTLYEECMKMTPIPD